MVLRGIQKGIEFRVQYYLSIIMIISSISLTSANTVNGWKLLLDNKPYEAIEEFKKTVESSDTRIAAESYRGLAITETFLGKFDNALDYGVSAFEKDHNVLRTASHTDLLLTSRYQPKDSKEKKFSKVISELAQNAGLFSGWFWDTQLRYSLSSGNLQKAKELCKKMGVQSSWEFIGPFENISNCGFSNLYPPEKEIRFDREYVGKNENIVRWHNLFTTQSRGWVFLDNITNEYNSIFYFTNTVTSRQKRDVYLSFGASGTFKVFLNGTLALQDSVFRNTGIDAYMKKVTLREGVNRIVIKIGHEGLGNIGLSGRSNFLLRFLDMKYNPVTTLQTGISDTLVASDNTVYPRSSDSPVLDSLTGFLNHRIQKDSTDYDALLSLISIYNLYEMTNESQQSIQRYLKKKPSSSILHSYLAESFMRAKKSTEAAVEMKKAYDLCGFNKIAWDYVLKTLKNNNNTRMSEEFLKKSPEIFRTGPEGILTGLTIAIEQKNRSEAIKIISDLETRYSDNSEIVMILASIYSEQGMIDKAEKLIQEQIGRNNHDLFFYFKLAELALKRGDRLGAIKWYQQAITAYPENPEAYQYLSYLFYEGKKYQEALEYADKCAKLLPASANVMNLKGNVLSSMGKIEDAIASFKETIRYTSDDFSAWESIFRLKKQPGFEELTPLQSVDSIISNASAWVEQNNTKASLVSYIQDIYMYPSRASRSRTFLVVHLPNQQEIDKWKEYRIPYNPNYQLLSIDRAFSKKSDGTEIEADRGDNEIVFKSLEPGDYIVLEYSKKDYYQGTMAGKVYGTELFGNEFPEFSSMIRMVTPIADTIPVFISDTSFTVSTDTIHDYRIKTIKSKSSSPKIAEAFSPSYHPDYSAVVYSNLKSWKEISDWYYELSRHKQKRTLELTKITDSLISGAKSDWEKVLRIHEFMSRTINYSYVPFRQSAWIPQSARDVFASRIGDCKDMASLGKALLDIAGIESWLVLVNTEIRHFTGYAYIGPNFDHCILSFIIDGKSYFVDFTSRNTALGRLPMGDQGAMALVIKPGNDSLITLPTDSPSDRTVTRTITMSIDSSGAVHQTTKATKTGVYASSFRDMYRFVSYEEQKKTVHNSITDDYPDAIVDTLYFDTINSLKDTLDYVYTFHADHAAEISSSTVLLSLKIPDALSSNYYPLDENRRMPVDMSFSATGIADLFTTIECSFPPKWKLTNLPEPITVHSGSVEYSLSFTLSKGKIVCKRSYKGNYTGVLSAKEYRNELIALKKITRADNIKLVFTK